MNEETVTTKNAFLPFAEDFIPYKPYRVAEQLIAAEKNGEKLTDEEEERLKRIKLIPETVKEALKREIDRNHKDVMKLEAINDRLMDFLNGEETP